MTLLLDTNVLIWWLTEDRRLSSGSLGYIQQMENAVFVSVVSIWEIAIKASIGKLQLGDSPEQLILQALRENRFDVLPIRSEHAFGVASLPFHHSDPFDRLLISQAKFENLTLMTSDSKLGLYDVPIIQA